MSFVRNTTKHKYKRGYYDLFVRACSKYPYNVAVRLFEDNEYKCYTYSELYGVCEYISQQLQQLDCNKGVIGLVCRTNIIVPCVIAAVHKACTTFMFLDPINGIDESVTDIPFSVIISIQKGDQLSYGFPNKKPDKTFQVFGMNINLYNYVPHSSAGRSITDHSYIAMTSGSTGSPKKIQVPLHCLLPNIDDLTSIFNICPEDVIYFSTPLTFDPSLVEIIIACKNGASLLIAPADVRVLFPKEKEHAVTVWQTTPSLFFQLSNVDIKNKILNAKSSLKILALGGEPLNGINRLRELKDSNNKTKIFTLYGVTEMSCWASITELDLTTKQSDLEVPLGKCLSETKIIVEPETSNAGKKYTGKVILVSKTRRCVVLNKKNANEEISSLKFVDTGDIGEVSNGTIYYRGRKDDVIKRFGHKVNLQTIENVVMQCPRIKTCSCVWLPKPKLVVVYYTSESFPSSELSYFLKCKLNDRQWPDRIVRVDDLPMTAHGKVNKLMLSKIFENKLPKPTLAPTMNALKADFLHELKALVNESFTYDDIKDKDFFSLGGTSFFAISLSNRLSLAYPEFGKFLLQHLLTQSKTIDQIMELADKEVLGMKPKKKMKFKQTSEEKELSISINSTTDFTYKCELKIDLIELWTYDTGKCVDASPSLLQTGVNLYITVGSHSGEVVIIDAMTGIVVGTIDLKSRIEAAVYCYDGDSSLPPIGIVGSYNGTVACFAIEICKELWRTNVGSMVKSKATVCKDFVYVASYDGFIRKIDILTGCIKGAIPISDQGISANLVLAKNTHILVGALSGVCASVHAETNTLVWRTKLGSPIFANPVVYDDEKYVLFAEVSGEIHCMTVEKGIKIWKYSGARGNIFSSIHVKKYEGVKYQMVFGCHDNHVYSLITHNFQPTLHWKTELTSPVYASPCALGKNAFLAASNNGKLAVISTEGILLGEYNLPGEIFSSPAVYGEYVFIGCRNDLVYCLRCVTNS